MILRPASCRLREGHNTKAQFRGRFEHPLRFPIHASFDKRVPAGEHSQGVQNRLCGFSFDPGALLGKCNRSKQSEHAQQKQNLFHVE